MPGRHLNQNEDRLLRFWEDPPNNLRRPLLRSLEVAGGNGLRGLDGVLVPFNYPITAICGKNGSGKSTVLALTALAHHSPDNWHVHWTNTRHRASKPTENRSYYVFPDFFVFGQNETIPNGVRVTWRCEFQGNEISTDFVKTPKKWGTYNQRPEREVTYVPLSRVLPAHESSAVRNAFKGPNPQADSLQLTPEYREYLSYIMGSTYNAARILKTDRLMFADFETSVRYSGFNMGSGENCVAQLLHLLHRMPPCGLLVIEEIESCLHPEAQKRLAEVLVTVCYAKKLQIICSTHSEVFLDALPRQARLMLRKHDANNPVVENPSTRFSVYEMTGEVQPELTIYCEDRSAAVLIEEAVPYGDRTRLRIVDVGSDATVIRQGVSHLRGAFPGVCLCVPDGDTTQGQLDNWLQSETGGDAQILPETQILPGGNIPPERWVMAQLGIEVYLIQFSAQIGCNRAEAQGHINAMNVELNHHDIAHTLSKRTGLDRADCLRRIMKSVASNHPELNDLREKINDLLN